MILSSCFDSVRSVAKLAQRAWPVPLVVGFLAASCSDEKDSNGDGNEPSSSSAGSGGMGTAGSGMGTAGTSLSGSGGMGMGGSGGMSMGGAGGMGMGGGVMASGGGTGFLEVLNDDAAALLGPTTAAIVGDTVWVAIGQLAQLFEAQPNPSLPFGAVSIPLTGGAVGSDVIEVGNGRDFFLEGISAGADDELFLGMVTRGQIARVAPGSTSAGPLTNEGDAERGVIGLAADPLRDLLWYCDSNPVADIPGGALVGVSTVAGSLGDEVVRHELPVNLIAPPAPEAAAADVDAGVGQDGGVSPVVADAGASVEVAPFCNDVIVLDGGDLLLTDSTGRIFRIASDNVLTADSAEVWLKSPQLEPPVIGGFGVNGLEIVGGSLIVANSDLGQLIEIDPNSSDPASTLRQLPITEGGFVKSLCGPDGLAAVPGTDNQLVVVENGFCEAGIARVLKVTLDLD